MLIYTSLYNKSIVNSSYLGERIYNLLDKTFILPKGEFNYNIFEVSDEYIARPDLISLDAYGDTMYADIICKINGISNPFEVNAGMLFIMPSPDSIMNFVQQSNEIELESYQSQTPVVKMKNEKRKPNEAVLGDSRFRIDSATGVIIY